MSELIVKNVAFNYSPVEDRVLLRCLVAEDCYELWLTQRMLHQLLPELTNWLSRSGLGTAQTQDFMRSTLLQRSSSGAQAAMKQEALSATTDKADGEAPVASSNCSQPAVSPEEGVWLCTKANLMFGDQRLRMKLESEFSSQRFMFSMTLLEASHFLMVLRNALKNTDWSCQWPEWLPLVEQKGLPQDMSFLH